MQRDTAIYRCPLWRPVSSAILRGCKIRGPVMMLVLRHPRLCPQPLALHRSLWPKVLRHIDPFLDISVRETTVSLDFISRPLTPLKKDPQEDTLAEKPRVLNHFTMPPLASSSAESRLYLYLRTRLGWRPYVPVVGIVPSPPTPLRTYRDY